MNDIHIRLRQLRKQNDLEAADIAQAMNMTANVYGKRESGYTPFKAHELLRLRDKVYPTLNLHWFLTGEGESNVRHSQGVD